MFLVATFDCSLVSLHLYHQGRCYRTKVVDLACDLVYQVCTQYNDDKQQLDMHKAFKPKKYNIT